MNFDALASYIRAQCGINAFDVPDWTGNRTITGRVAGVVTVRNIGPRPQSAGAERAEPVDGQYRVLAEVTSPAAMVPSPPPVADLPG